MSAIVTHDRPSLQTKLLSEKAAIALTQHSDTFCGECARAAMLEAEKTLMVLSEKMLLGVAFEYGKDSAEDDLLQKALHLLFPQMGTIDCQ